MLHLRVIEGPERGKEYESDASSVWIGRGDECHLTMSRENLAVSRRHGEFVLKANHTIYRDTSKLGTTIQTRDGQVIGLNALCCEWDVRPGDRLVVGTSVMEVVSTFSQSETPYDPGWTYHGDLGPMIAIERHDDVESEPGPHHLLTDFLRLPSYDPTDIEAAKQTLGRALLDAFPQSSTVSIVELKPHPGPTLSSSDIDATKLLVMNHRGLVHEPRFSFSVLAETYQRHTVTCYSQMLHSTESVPRPKWIVVCALPSLRETP